MHRVEEVLPTEFVVLLSWSFVVAIVIVAIRV